MTDRAKYWECKEGHEPNRPCCNTVGVVPPKEAGTCILCNSREWMYAEIPVCGDWHGRGFVMRIGCVCEKAQAIPNADWRTSFDTYDAAIEQWNDDINSEATYFDLMLP